jgi:hypothetical protein
LSKPIKLKQLDNLLKEILADRRPASWTVRQFDVMSILGEGWAELKPGI